MWLKPDLLSSVCLPYVCLLQKHSIMMWTPTSADPWREHCFEQWRSQSWFQSGAALRCTERATCNLIWSRNKSQPDDRLPIWPYARYRLRCFGGEPSSSSNHMCYGILPAAYLSLSWHMEPFAPHKQLIRKSHMDDISEVFFCWKCTAELYTAVFAVGWLPFPFFHPS